MIEIDVKGIVIYADREISEVIEVECDLEWTGSLRSRTQAEILDAIAQDISRLRKEYGFDPLDVGICVTLENYLFTQNMNIRMEVDDDARRRVYSIAGDRMKETPYRR